MAKPALSTSEETQSWLEIRDLEGAVTRFELAAPTALIGRVAESDIRLDHGMVSRKHAQITRDRLGLMVLRDLGSRNGTLVNDVIVTERTLADGDRITIGPFTLSVHLPNDAELQTYPTRLTVADLGLGRIATLKEVETPRVLASHLAALPDFFDKLMRTPDPRQRVLELCQLMTGSEFKAIWSAVLRISGEIEADPMLVAEAHGGPRPEEVPHVSRGVLRAMLKRGESVVATNLPESGDLQVSIDPEVIQLATIACPLAREVSHTDVLYSVFAPEYGTGEWLSLATLATRQFQQAEGAWAARRQAEAHAVIERDLARARQIQMRLVPREPVIPGLELAIGFSPCRSVGGDYVDVVRLEGGKVFMAVADVCGKGLPAALVASSVHTMVHAGLLGRMGLETLVNNLNLYLRSMLPEENFVTMIAVFLDLASGSLEYINAGHPAPLVISPNRKWRELGSGLNLPLRLETDQAYCRTDKLAPGEVLALYTDGLTDITIESGDGLGTDGLARELSQLYTTVSTPVRDIAAGLTRSINTLQATSAAQDDRTFLLARHKSAGRGSEGTFI